MHLRAEALFPIRLLNCFMVKLFLARRGGTTRFQRVRAPRARLVLWGANTEQLTRLLQSPGLLEFETN